MRSRPGAAGLVSLFLWLTCLGLSHNCQGQITSTPDRPPAWTGPAGTAAAVQTPSNEGEASADSPRLRLVWGGGTERSWRCRIRVERGTPGKPELLGLNTDTPGSCWIDSEILHVVSPSATTFNGVDFDVDGNTDSIVQLEMETGEPNEPVWRRRWTLAELLDGEATETLDDEGNRVSVRRVPGDFLRVDLRRPHLVFEPGEVWPTALTVNRLPGFAGRQVTLRATMTSARKTRPVLDRQAWPITLDDSGSSPPLEWTARLPLAEGAYDLLLEIEPRWQQASLAPRRWNRRIQVIVIDPARPLSTAKPTPWRTLHTVQPRSNTIRPAAGSTAAGLPSLKTSALPSLRRSSANSEPVVVSQTDSPEWLQLGPGEWQAIDLPVGTAGKPHRVTIEYRAAEAIEAGFSILQPDETGNLVPVGEDSGLALHRMDRTSLPPGWIGQVHQHRLYFWPRHPRPQLLIANRHAHATLEVGLVEIADGPETLPVLEETDETRGVMSGSARTAAPGGLSGDGSGGRQVLAFLEAPLFADRFGATRPVDPVSGQAIDDWQTFHEGAERWIQSLRAAGFSGAVLCVANEGSAIFPSAALQPTPRHDNGVFSSDGADPVRKDVLEMLARMFDREGMQLIPVVEWKSPLPALEQLRREKELTESLPAQAHGWYRPTGSEPGDTFYDPLATAARRELVAITRDLASRYAHHSSLAGVGWAGRPDGWATTMDVTNGMVSESLQQFSTETGILLPADLDGARQALISGEHWPHWLAWRNNRLGELFAELEQNLQAVAPGRKFCLAMTDSFRCGELAETTSPRLHGVVDPQQVAGLAGWNEAVWQSPRMMLMQPHRNAPQEDALWQKSERGADPHRAAIFSNAGYATALFVHRSAPVQFNASSQQPLLGESDLRVTRLQPLSPPGSLARKRFAEALHSSDLRCLADGGWLPTAGQEEFTARMFAAFRQLPDRDFADLPALDAATDPGAVRVRQAATGEDWMAYLVNASPWPVSVEIPIRSSGLCLPRVWGNGSVQWQEDRQTAGSGSLQVQLEAWGLVVCRIDQPALQASGFRSQLPQDAGQLLQEQVFRLQSLLSQPAVPQAREWLRNPSFDGPDEKPEGWRWSVAQGTLVRSLADPSDPSNRCLELQGGNQPVWIRSSQFRVPDTGRLSFSIRLRADRPWEEISLRLSVESSANRRPWYRYGTVSQASGGSNTPSGVPRSSAEWNEYVVHFDDLPADPDALLRVGLDLMGPGTVLADDVRLFDDRWSERDIRAITQIVATAGNLLSDPNQADQSRRLLESYWPLCFEELATRRPAIESSRMTPPVLQASSAPLPESSAAGSQPASVRESGETSLEAATQRTPWRLRRPRRGNEPLLPIHRSP